MVINKVAASERMNEVGVMADHIGDDISTEGSPIPDVAADRARVPRAALSDNNKLLSINAPALTGKAGGNQQQGTRKIGWIHRHAADDEGQHGGRSRSR